MPKLRRLALLMTTALASSTLAGCLETSFAINAAKQVTRNETTRQQGIYKVGEPYQINGVWYYPQEDYSYNETGIASFYGGEKSGTNFHGLVTANGETYDMNALTAAHQTLPLPSLVRVTNLENGRSLVLRVNDRGPFIRGRIIDVSRRGAQLLGYEGKGTAMVRVQILAPESQQLKLAMLQGTAPPASEQVAAAPRTAVTSDSLPPPPGSRSTTAVASAALPSPSETVSRTANPTTQEQRRDGRSVTRTQPLARPAAPVSAPAGQSPSGSPVITQAAPVAPTNRPATAPVSREVAALPVPDQPAARATVTQQAVKPTSLYIQAGAFANYDNAMRLSSKLSRFGASQVSQVSVGGQQFFRVRVGPVSTVQEADTILEGVTNDAPQARIVAD